MLTVGIDEVGRGCWAGPLVAGAVLMPTGYEHPLDSLWKLADSKIMCKAEREVSDVKIRKIALAVGLGWAAPREIDRFGLTRCVGLAMKRALRQIDMDYDEIVIDGNIDYLKTRVSYSLIKADAIVPAVSAASILAKVARDTWMREVAAKKYPAYGFDAHVGYGTKQHMAAMQRYGVTPLHRQSYLPVQNVQK